VREEANLAPRFCFFFIHVNLQTGRERAPAVNGTRQTQTGARAHSHTKKGGSLRASLSLPPPRGP